MNKTKFSPNLIKELKSFLVERYVDNMSTKDLVAYVMDDLDRYYEKMSDLLDALIKERKQQALKYKDYLKKIIELSGQVCRPENNKNYPKTINNAGKRALFDNLGQNEELALKVDSAVRTTKKDGFRGNRFKEREIEIAIRAVLSGTEFDEKQILELVKSPKNGY